MMKKNCKVCGEEFFQPKKHYYIGMSESDTGTRGKYLITCSDKCRAIRKQAAIDKANARQKTPEWKAMRKEQLAKNQERKEGLL
jgi:hypothetical protein